MVNPNNNLEDSVLLAKKIETYLQAHLNNNHYYGFGAN